MKVKIIDVAKEAHVSVATVSRVVNDIPLVNEDTKQRVLNAIEKTGYKPNAIARSLKIQKTNTLGIMIPDLANPLYTDIIRGAEDAAAIYKYNIILSNTDFSENREEDSLDVLVEKQCDGIIYIGNDLTENMREMLLKANCEVVLGCVEDKDGEISAVLIDNESAAYDLAKSLLDKGHKKIAIFTDYQSGQISDLRLKGIRRALEEQGLELDENLVIPVKDDIKYANKLAIDFFEEGNDCDVIICMNDRVALGVIRAIESTGRVVPDDVSVTGFSDFWVAPWMKPTLTSVKQPMYDLGAIAARMLIKKIENETDPNSPDTIRVPYEIIYRESTI